ncbi:MAG: ABC transporter permease [Thermoleophilia bacterium]|nr:ABC transporter permease [Thermoleophilia bacterium]
MARFVTFRVITAVCLLTLLSLITFVVYATIPVEPAGFLVDLQHAKPSQIAAAHDALGLNHSVWYRYGDYLRRLAHGDFGTAWSSLGIGYDGQIHGAAVGHMVYEAAGVTGSIILGGAVLLVVIAVPLALVSARAPRSVLDRTVVAISLVGISTHPLVIGVVLRLMFGERWRWLPPTGYCNLTGPPALPDFRLANGAIPQGCGGLKEWTTHLILPWLTFALFFVALYMRMLRARLLETLHTHYVRTARAKGAGEFRVLGRHALPNVVAPMSIMLAMDAGTAIGISIYIESVYFLPGVGHLLLNALNGERGYDLPLILGVMFISATAIIALNALADVIARVIDPRITSISRSGAGGVRSGLA